MDTKKLDLLKEHFRELATHRGFITEADYHNACADIKDPALLNAVGDWIVAKGFALRKGVGDQYKQEVMRQVKNPSVNDVKDTKHRTHKNKNKFQKSKKKEVGASFHLNKSIEKMQEYKDEFLPAWKKFKAALVACDAEAVYELIPILAQFGEGTPLDVITQAVEQLNAYGITQVYISDIPGVSDKVNFASAPEVERANITDLELASQRDLGRRLTEIMRDPQGALSEGLYSTVPPSGVAPPQEQMPSSVTTEFELEEGAPLELSKKPLYTGRRHAKPNLLATAATRVGYTTPDRVRVAFSDGPSFTTYVADTPAKKASGLEVFSSLGDDEGLFFPFDESGTVTFHMGSVQFPIDIVFLMPSPHGMEVGKIVSDAQPGSADWWSHPNTAAVLEIPGGACKKHGIKIGSLCRASRRIVADFPQGYDYSLPEYAGEYSYLDLFHLLSMYYGGQGDPLYAVQSRGDNENISEDELWAIESVLEDILAGKYESSDEEDYDIAEAWLPEIKELSEQASNAADEEWESSNAGL